ncbi:hypothetical protein ILUMI_12156, partial [Ignelater luminosus]
MKQTEKEGSDEIETAIFKLLHSLPQTEKNVTLTSDTYGGQNRNRFMAAFLLDVANTTHFEEINLKFLQTGHTQMEVNSIHSLIERAKKGNIVHSLLEWPIIIRSASKKYPLRVEHLEYSDFIDLKHLKIKLIPTGNLNKDPEGSAVHHLEYAKDKKNSCELWSPLCNVFERKGIASQLLIRKSLLTMKSDSTNDTLANHFLKFDKSIRDLRSTGATLEETDIVCHLLLTMPNEYEVVVTALETLSKKDLTLNFVKNQLLEEELKRKSTGVTKKEGDSFNTMTFPSTRNFSEEGEMCVKNGKDEVEEYIESKREYVVKSRLEDEVKSSKENEVVTFQRNSKWVFKIKEDKNGNVERYKARLVIKNCAQRKDYDYEETYAPFARLTTLRTLISVIKEKDLYACQMDLKNAFLHGKIKEEIYMKIPFGFNWQD